MKYIKLFENLSKTIEVGDYVVATDYRTDYVDYKPEMKEWLESHIGRIIKGTFKGEDSFCLIEYDEIHPIGTYFFWIKKSNILHISKNKKNLELYITPEYKDSIKYNL